MCQDSSVGIATTVKAGRSGDEIAEGAGISAPIQIGAGADTAYYTMGTGVFLGLIGHGLAFTAHPSLRRG